MIQTMNIKIIGQSWKVQSFIAIGSTFIEHCDYDIDLILNLNQQVVFAKSLVTVTKAKIVCILTRFVEQKEQ